MLGRQVVVNRTKFESSRREIKADIKKQHDLYVNNLVDDVKGNLSDFYSYINGQKKTDKISPPPPTHTLKKRGGNGVAELNSERQRDSLVNSMMCSIKLRTMRFC